LSKQMSKALNLLNGIEKQRTGKYSSALNKGAIDSQTTQQPVRNTTEGRNIQYAIRLIIPILISLILGLSFSLVLIANRYKSERNSTAIQLTEIKDLLNKNTKQINSFSEDIKQLSSDLNKMSLKIQSISSDIKELNKNSETQSFAIETLTKAKNTLFNKLNSLEVDIDELKTNKQ